MNFPHPPVGSEKNFLNGYFSEASLEFKIFLLLGGWPWGSSSSNRQVLLP